MFVCVIDPSDSIFHLKTVLLVLSLIIGFISYYKEMNTGVVVVTVIWAIAIPLFYFLIGLFFQSNYSFSNAIDSFKPYSLFLLLPFIVNTDFSYLIGYFKVSLQLIIVTGIIYLFFAFGEIPLLEVFIGDYENTMKIALRPYGNLTLLMIYHNSISILLFGFAYSLYKSKNSKWFFFLSILSLVVLILSSTRANMLGCVVILLYHIYDRYFSFSVNRKVLFLSILIFLILFTTPFVVSNFFSSDEQSLSDKVGFIDDYSLLWKNNPVLLLFGQGLGGGIQTSLRGLSYNLETTYFEILRIYGLIGVFVFFFMLLFPVLLFYLNNKKFQDIRYYNYVFVSYLVYLFLVIPSNPLLFSSTGFFVILLFYSETLQVSLSSNESK